MKKMGLAVALSLLVGVAAGLVISTVARPTQSRRTGRRIVAYRNPMDPRITSDRPMKDPMGMDYVPVYSGQPPAGAIAGERRVLFYRDPSRPWITAEIPGTTDAGVEFVPVREGDPDAKGIAINPVMVQDTGVRTEEVSTRTLRRVIRAAGSIAYDERNVYDINLKFTGWVDFLYVDFTGQAVRRGDPLMDIYSPELVSTQQEYLSALRLRETTGARLRGQAERLVESARRRLRLWDVPEDEIEALTRRGTPRRTLTLRSPADGIVLAKPVMQGSQVQPGMMLLKLVGLSDVWVYAEVFPQDAAWVRRGQDATVTLPDLPGRSLPGHVDFLQPVATPGSRTLRVRVEVEQPGGGVLLRPDMVATVEIRSPVSYDAVAVPEQAIIHSGARTIAIMALGKGYFEPREVELGVAAEGFVEVRSGIQPGERIVTSSQFLIDSESNLGTALGALSGPDAGAAALPVNELPGMKMPGMDSPGEVRP